EPSEAADELEAMRIERDNWKLSAEEAMRAEKRWKDRAVEADRQARAAEAEAEHLHVEDTREIVALTQERNQLAAVVEKVRDAIEGESGWFRHRAGRVLDILASAPDDALLATQGVRRG